MEYHVSSQVVRLSTASVRLLGVGWRPGAAWDRRRCCPVSSQSAPPACFFHSATTFRVVPSLHPFERQQAVSHRSRMSASKDAGHLSQGTSRRILRASHRPIIRSTPMVSRPLLSPISQSTTSFGQLLASLLLNERRYQPVGRRAIAKLSVSVRAPAVQVPSQAPTAAVVESDI